MPVEKRSFLRGATGSSWLDDAWFTLEIDDQSPNLNDINQFMRLEKRLTRERVHTFEDDAEALKPVGQAIQNGSSRYVWALPRLWDALNLLRWHGHALYRPYEKPSNASELYLTNLFVRFPMRPESTVELLIFAGNGICADPDFSNHHAEVKQPLAGWRLSSVFEYGLWLVKLQPEQPVYRIEEVFARQLRDEAMQLFHPEPHPDRTKLEPALEKSLPRMITRLFGCQPGKKPAK